jgi:hypothetical protein
MQAKHLNLLINTGGGLVGLIVVGYVAYSALHTEVEQPCSSRYPAPKRFSLQTAQGKPLTAIELQARAGLRDLGVIDNAAVVSVDGGPSPEALEVKLRKLPRTGDKARNGIEFRWSPPGVASATSACLTYSAWLPEKFQFGAGGHLPGMFAGDPSAARGKNETGRVAPHWEDKGKILLLAAVEGADPREVAGDGTALATDSWISVEQEIVLNAPGESNGIARLWIDGALVASNESLSLRKDAKTLLGGVLAAVGYRHLPEEPGTLRLSPLEIAWR